MRFKNQGHPFNNEGMDHICSTLGISEPEVWAVLTVETRGFGFLKDRRPQILFERHIFHKRTKGTHDTGHEDISNAKSGGYVGGVGEYPRLEKANLHSKASRGVSAKSWVSIIKWPASTP